MYPKPLKVLLKVLDGAVNLAALVMILGCILFSGYSLWDANQVYRAAASTVYEAYIPTEEDTHSFEELRAINPEVMGWLRVNDTSINYPLLQGEDNSKYVNTDVEGNYSLSGAIFLHCMNAPDFTDFNSIIYGHHMEKNKMFGDIGLFTDEAYFESHPYGSLFFDGRDHGLEFFAFLTVDAYDEVFYLCPDEEPARTEYLERIYDLAAYVRDLDVTTEDRLVLLSTCTTSMTNGRNILVGRLSDTLYPEAEEPLNLGTGVDALEESPLWLWILAAALLLLIIYLTLRARRRAKKRREDKHEDQNR